MKQVLAQVGCAFVVSRAFPGPSGNDYGYSVAKPQRTFRQFWKIAFFWRTPLHGAGHSLWILRLPLSRIRSARSLRMRNGEGVLCDYSFSERSLPIVGLCFSCLRRFLLSARFTGGGAPIAARAMALTALVARKGLGFFLFGTSQVNHRGHRVTQRIPEPILRVLYALCG